MGWAKEPEQGGAEWADIVLGGDALSARGIGVAARPVPCRMAYALWTGPGFVTRRLRVTTRGDGWRRVLDLRRRDDGTWTADARAGGHGPFVNGRPLAAPGADADVLDALRGADDCDLGWCPLTNTMPVLRRRLLVPGPPADFTMAWVSVPDLAVRRSDQRYTFIRQVDDDTIVRYESGSFSADVRFDPAGFVVDYPGLGRRL